MDNIFTDPTTGRRYTTDPVTGQSRWLDDTQAASAPSTGPDYPAAAYGQPVPDPYQQSYQQPYQQRGATPDPAFTSQPYPGPQPPQPGGSSSRTGLIIALVALLVILLGGVGTAAFLLTKDDSKNDAAVSSTSSSVTTDSTGTTPTSDGSSSSETNRTRTVTVNESVDVSYFEITVTQIEYGYTQLKNEELVIGAEGQFAVVSCNITNTDSYTHFYLTGYETAIDSNGTTVKATPSIYFYDITNDPFGEDLGPGDTASGVIAFDIPRDATLSTITFEYLGKTGTLTPDQ